MPHPGLAANQVILIFLKEFWLALKGVPGFIGVVATFLMFVYPPDQSLPARWVVPGLLVLLAIIVALGEVAIRSISRGSRGLPRVIQARKPPVGSEPVLVLLEPSEHFSVGDMVSFFFVDDTHFEQFLGVGSVVNLQQDGSIQALLEAPVLQHAALIDRLANNEDAVKRQVRVKPSVSQAHQLKVREQANDIDGH